MARVASVRLPFDPRTRWFDPADVDLHAGDGLVVRTSRGLEYGQAVGEIAEVDDLQVQALRSPLQPVVRVATDEDRAQRDEMKRLSDEALPVFKRLAAETNENMHPIMVQYLFDGNRAVFLFEAEERTDFRNLVRRLSSELHVHVDMRQIGVRDEARIVGGIGHCGQELCCARMGGNICPVSIKMAKAQDLSLNPQQISGVCGRLMCCLRYEYDAYKDFKARAPKNNATIHTPEGDFKVCQLDMMHEIVVLRTDDNKRVRIPLSAFDMPDPDAESKRPRSIGDAYYEYANAEEQNAHATLLVGSTERFTGTDKLAEKGEIHHNPSREERERHRRRSGDTGHPASRRRRHSTRGGQDSRDGRRQHGSSRDGSGSREERGSRSQAADARRSSHGSGNGHRRSRNRNHNVSEEQKARRANAAEGAAEGTRSGSKADAHRTPRTRQGGQGGSSHRSNRASERSGGKSQASKPQSERKPRSGASSADKGTGSASGATGASHSAHRRSRRRSHKTGSGGQGGAPSGSAPKGSQGGGAAGGRPNGGAAGGGSASAGGHGTAGASHDGGSVNPQD